MKTLRTAPTALLAGTFCRLLVLILAAAAVPSALAQDEGAGDVSAKKRDAVMILEEAAVLQGGEEIQADLKNFRAVFNLELFDPDEGRGNFYVERFFAYRDDSGIMWTKKRRDDPRSPCTVTVYNGEEAWRIGEKGRVQIFTDRPSQYKTDLQNLLDDVRLTSQMYRFFFVKTLLETVDDLRLLGKRRIDGKPVHVIEGTTTAWLGGEGTTRVLLKIAVEREKNRIFEVTLTDLALDGQKRRFRFGSYRRNEQGVLVPCQVKIFGEDEQRHEMQVGLRVTSEEIKNDLGETVKEIRPVIAFNVPMPESAFEVPDPDKIVPPEKDS